jgi:hypothetical protein
MKQKSSSTGVINPAVIAGIIVLVAAALGGAFFYSQRTMSPSVRPSTPSTGSGACTMDAMICPDGSAVGRTGPNCEFAPCPTDSASDENPVLLVKTNLLKIDTQGTVDRTAPKIDVVLPLPAGSVVTPGSSSFESRVKVGESDFLVSTPDKLGGLCPWVADSTECKYTDQASPHMFTLRVWERNTGVFALNPQGVDLEGYYFDFFLITKADNSSFTPEEVSTWRQILAGIAVRTTEMPQ